MVTRILNPDGTPGRILNSANNPARAARQGRGHGGLKPGGKRLTMEQAKLAFVDFVSSGYNINAACDRVQRSRKTYESWRKNDASFRKSVDSVMATRKVTTSTREENRSAARVMGFAEWRMKYLGLPTYPHSQQWVDLIEGREPSNLHPSQSYEPGKPTRVLINCPPNHGKTTVLTLDYVAYRICVNPAIKIAIISKTADMAEDMLYGVKMRLTHPDNEKLIKDFAPEGGFLATADEWSASRIRLSSADRDPADKDPTLQALGLGSQVYGKRLDLVLIDDAIDGSNAQGWQIQMRWMQTEVASRPGSSGKIVVIGTRIAPADLYYQLRNPTNFHSGKSPWTYLSQPAVLEEHPNRADWVTLWPRATVSWYTVDEDCWCGTDDCQHGDGTGTFPRWDGPHIAAVRDDIDQSVWLQAYMQHEVGGDTAFPAHGIAAATNNGRRAGLEGGMYRVPKGCYVIGSVDPATTGYAGMLVYALDPTTHKRYVYDAWNIAHPTPGELKDRIMAASLAFRVDEWRIEKTGLLTMFTQDRELNQWLAGRGIRLTTHYTGKNKFDTNFGVASMSSLFGSWQHLEDGDYKAISEPLIELPRATDSTGVQALIHQLSIWTPETDPKKTPCDMVMSLWFAEIGARDRINSGVSGVRRRRGSRFLSPRDKAKRAVIDFRTLVGGDE